MFLGAMPDGSHGERSKNLMYHVSEFERGTVPKKGTRVTYVRGQYNRQPVARVIRVVEARGRASSWARVPASQQPAVQLPRTVNGTGHTGPSEFCATSI